jgi:hypothetical protein
MSQRQNLRLETLSRHPIPVSLRDLSW